MEQIAFLRVSAMNVSSTSFLHTFFWQDRKKDAVGDKYKIEKIWPPEGHNKFEMQKLGSWRHETDFIIRKLTAQRSVTPPRRCETPSAAQYPAGSAADRPTRTAAARRCILYNIRAFPIGCA